MRLTTKVRHIYWLEIDSDWIGHGSSVKNLELDKFFGTFKVEYSWMDDFIRIILLAAFKIRVSPVVLYTL